MMFDCSLINYSLKLINKHARHILYLQFIINIFQMYFSVSVNKVIFYDDLRNFCKTIYFRYTFFRVPCCCLRCTVLKP